MLRYALPIDTARATLHVSPSDCSADTRFLVCFTGHVHPALKGSPAMHGLRFLSSPGSPPRPAVAASQAARPIALLRSGRRRGPITRLITPWDIGELTQPFLFLGYSELESGPQTLHGALPPSGIATLTLILSGALTFEGPSGSRRILTAGGFHWVTTGEGEWHDGGRVAGIRLRALQLWLELSPSQWKSSPQSRAVAAHEMPEEGAVRVVLGQFGRARSRLVDASPEVNYFHVRLKEGERWRYAAPDGHNVTWLAVDRGALALQESERIYRDQVAVFGDSRGVIEMRAVGDTSFVLGSARRSAHPVVLAGELPMDTTLTPRKEAPRGSGRPRFNRAAKD